MARLKDTYYKSIVPAMMKEFKYKSVMQVPRLEKVVLNVGLGEATQNIKAVDYAVQDISSITGQKPVITTAKKSIASFKLRQGMSIGCKVTLRGERMYEFLEIEYDKIDKIRGMNITINTTAKNDNEARSFLRHLGMPFRS